MKAALRQTGLTADTLRAWERRYAAVTPRRSKSGRRVYSDAEVYRLRLLADLVRQGFSIGEIALDSEQELVAHLAEARAQMGSSTATQASVAAHVIKLLSAVHKFNLAGIKAAVSRVRFVCSPREFALYLVPQLMREVGLKIDRGEFDISQEHALSDLVRHQLREIYEELEPLEGSIVAGPNTMVFSSPEGQYHDLGLLLSAIVCRYRGVGTRFLGANLPAASLAQAAREFKASAVVISMAYVDPHEKSREKVMRPQEFLMEIDRLLPENVSVWLGGGGTQEIRPRELKREVWIFESLDALENKLNSLLGTGA